MPAAPSPNGPGDIALVTGFVAIVFSFVPIVGEFVAVPAAVLAVGSGSVGISRVERGLATNPVAAWSGICLGLVAAFVTALVFMATSGFGP